MADKPSLDEFAATAGRKPTGYQSYLDRLPDDTKEQLLSSTAGHAAAERWLHSLGHTEATQQMVGNWRRKRGWVG